MNNGFPATWTDKATGTHSRFAHDWHYYPEQGGEPLGAVVRYESEHGSKVVVPFFAKTDDGRPRPGAPTEPRPLFGLNTLNRTGPIFICEGEKDAAALQGLGLAALTSQGGSKAPAKSDWGPLRALAEQGRSLLIWPDHDAPGRAYAATVARLIGSACQCLLTPPDGTPDTQGAGAADWLQGHMAALGLAWDGLKPPPLSEEERHAIRARLLTAVESLAGPPPPEWGGTAIKAERETQRHKTDAPKLYLMKDDRTIRITRGMDGAAGEQLLANFTATIVEEATRDDGQERTLTLVMEGRMEGRTLPAIALSMEQFARMDWPMRHWGSSALIHPGQGAKEQLKYAIQLLSHQGPRPVATRTLFTHTGWREIGGHWRYLSAGAVIGEQGAVAAVEVDLGELNEIYRLPAPSQTLLERYQAATASYDSARLAPPEVAIPLIAAVYLAPLAQRLAVDFALWLEGPSRSMKSTLAAVALAHFGEGVERTSLSASWLDTANAIGIKLFTLADALMVIDDYAPQASASDQAKLDKTVNTIIRGIGNRAGRGRLTSDIRLQNERKPRALAICTAEQWPTGESINARIFGLSLRPGMVNLERLNQTQADAKAGLLARALADCLQDLASGFEARARDLKAEWEEWRAVAMKAGLSGRTPEQAAFLLIGYGLALDHWRAAGVIDQAQANEHLDQARRVIFHLAKEHERRIARSQPADAFIAILTDLLLSGAAHLRDMTDQRPALNAESYGWKSGDQPDGPHIGWINEPKQELYLLPTTALEAIYGAAKRIDTPLNIRPTALKRQLWDRGFLLVGNQEQREGASVDRTTRKISVCNRKVSVLVFSLAILERKDLDEDR
ncbi:DNA primase [Thiocystis violascens]|uniref:DNA primase n=1 Tax=Thiocystis violascens (strain ATCC 17096 / DSM 198 / 6111) TaxID=765911 RepID=I3YES3_THIV6|nr:DNA primase [Thiocystis violascens]AFL75491.1 DNA primase [Thiocystis violascens DSM 198]